MESVSIAVPVYGPQFSEWWFPFMLLVLRWQQAGIDVQPIQVSAAMPDSAKNIAVRFHMRGNNTTITSAQRNELVKKNQADWIFFVDHDTLPPADALPRLLAHQNPFCAGVYYHKRAPHAPLMYAKTENGRYRYVLNFERGALMEVDAVGMGCTLIHRSVFEKIQAEFRCFARHNGTYFIVHQDDVIERGLPKEVRATDHPLVFQGPHGWHCVTPLSPISPQLQDDEPFPFYTMEEGRTEDIIFCEEAARVGFKPLVDTAIECSHWNPTGVNGDWFRNVQDVVPMWEPEEVV